MVSRDDGAVVVAGAAWRADPRRGEQAVLAHQAQHPALGRSHPGRAQPRPDLAVPLAVKGLSARLAADRRDQRRIGHRAARAWASRWLAMRRLSTPIDGRPGHAPSPTHPGHAVGLAGDGRDGPAHRLDLRRSKGRLPSRMAIFASSSSALEQHLAELGLQPPALELLPVRRPGGQARLTGGQESLLPAGQGGRGDTQRARHRLQVLAVQQAAGRRRGCRRST